MKNLTHGAYQDRRYESRHYQHALQCIHQVTNIITLENFCYMLVKSQCAHAANYTIPAKLSNRSLYFGRTWPGVAWHQHHHHITPSLTWHGSDVHVHFNNG